MRTSRDPDGKLILETVSTDDGTLPLGSENGSSAGYWQLLPYLSTSHLLLAWDPHPPRILICCPVRVLE